MTSQSGWGRGGALRIRGPRSRFRRDAPCACCGRPRFGGQETPGRWLGFSLSSPRLHCLSCFPLLQRGPSRSGRSGAGGPLRLGPWESSCYATPGEAPPLGRSQAQASAKRLPRENVFNSLRTPRLSRQRDRRRHRPTCSGLNTALMKGAFHGLGSSPAERRLRFACLLRPGR